MSISHTRHPQMCTLCAGMAGGLAGKGTKVSWKEEEHRTELKDAWIKLWFFQLLVLFIDFPPSRHWRVIVRDFLIYMYKS